MSSSALRELVSAGVRRAKHRDHVIRENATRSLEEAAAADPQLVVQTWLDQFARVNGGGSPAEYAAAERVWLLSCLERVAAVAKLDDTPQGRAWTGRLISLAADEMARQRDVIPDIQRPCRAVLVSLGAVCLDRVMDALLVKLRASPLPHTFVVSTLSSLAQAYKVQFLPYVQGILKVMAGHIKGVRLGTLS